MSIDINTLTMVASINTLLQVIALLVQWRLDKTHRGLGWWLLGMSATGLGFALAYLRTVPQWALMAIVGNNLSFVFGRAFMYIGVLHFFDRRERRDALIAFLAVFSLVDIYFTYLNNDIIIRRAIFNLTIAALSFLGGRASYLYKTRAVTTTANLLAATFLLNGIVFVVSLLFNVFTPPDAGPLIASVSQVVSILGGLIATLLTTIGFILLVNQRLYAEVQQSKDQLLQRATTDQLTGISNRDHFMELASQELKRAMRLDRSFALALIDLDHFKQINDTHGHAAGDQALQVFTQICQKNIREIDLFARFGGDEFVVLLPETNSEQAYQIVERVRLALLAQPIDLDGKPVSLTLSSGIATLNSERASVDALLSRADQALYRAKEAGRNQVIVEPSN